MPRVSAWECPRTKKLFRKKAQYVLHLKKLAKKSLEEKKEAKRKASKADFFKQMRNSCKTIQEVEAFIMANSEAFAGNAHDHNFHRSSQTPPAFQFTKVSLSARWNEHISNSHNAPFGRPQNWGRKDGCPTGYPGFYGRLNFSYTGNTDSFISDLFKDTGIDTGTGGGGCTSYSCEIILWAEDWPLLAEPHVRDYVLSRVLPKKIYREFA